MKKFNKDEHTVETSLSDLPLLSAIEHRMHNGLYGAYIGLDVHKKTISISVAENGNTEPEYLGVIQNTGYEVSKLIKRLNKKYFGQILLFCYEAGPCGYTLYHQIIAASHDCQVIAPSLIPTKSGEKVKTDRRDSLKLAKYLRGGDLTAVWVPDKEQEAMRDLTRARDDMKSQERKAKQQLSGFLLRNGQVWSSDKQKWIKAHYSWLEDIKFEHNFQQIVLQEYINAVKAACQRVSDITDEMMKALTQWSLAPVVDSLIALRGIDKISAMVLLSELGDISRFDSPKQLMAFLGLVPSEHSSGPRRKQGGITLAGNSHARRALIESSWSYRFPARQTKHIKSKLVNASEEAKAISWKAQKRLCGRYRTLVDSGKNTKVVCVAIARELTGFIWDIVCHEMPRLQGNKV